MALRPPAQTPPCERCGLPIVEGHYPDGRCPRPPRRSLRRRVIRGALGGLAGLITFVVVAVVLAGFWPPARLMPFHSGGRVMTGRNSGPGAQACELFYRWEVTGKTSLLNRAVADAWSHRVPLPWKVRFRVDFTGLGSWVGVEKKLAHSSDVPYNPSSPVAHNWEHAIQGVCNKFGAGLNSLDRREFRRDAAEGRRAAAHLNRSGN